MKDVTASGFGLFIAYIVPGTTLLYAFSLWASPADELVSMIMEAKADAGLTIGALIVVTGLGVLATAVRGAIFEHGENAVLPEAVTAAMSQVRPDDGRLQIYQLLIDQQYRYHQCFGGMLVALFVHLIAFLFEGRDSLSLGEQWVTGLLNVFVLLLLIWASRVSLTRYVNRTTNLFSDSNGASVETTAKETVIRADSVTITVESR